MTRTRHFKTTLPRVVVIVGATFAICYAIIGAAYIARGDLRSLLPPWQLVLVNVGGLSVLASLALSKSKPRSDKFVLVAATAISIAITALVLFIWGLGHTWGIVSALGKMLTTFLTLAYPIIFSTIAMLRMRNRSVGTAATWFASIALCLILMIPQVFIAVTLACVLTGDCL